MKASLWQLVATGETLAADLWRLNAGQGRARMIRCLELLEKRASFGMSAIVFETALAALDRLDGAPAPEVMH